MEVHPWSWIYFVSFVIVAAFVVLNVLIGIVLNSMEEAREIERRRAREPVSEHHVDVPSPRARHRADRDPRSNARGDRVRSARAACAASPRGSRPLLPARQLIERAPYRESGTRLLMEALAARGNRAEALVAFDALRRRLRDDLGSAPSPETQELHRRLLG